MEIAIFMFRLQASGSSVSPPSVGTRKSQNCSSQILSCRAVSRRNLRTLQLLHLRLSGAVYFWWLYSKVFFFNYWTVLKKEGGEVKIYMSRRKLRTPSYISFKLCTYITFVVRRTCILLGVYSTGFRIFGLWLIKRGVRDCVKTWHWFPRFLSNVWWSQ